MPHGDDSTWIQTYTGRQFWPLDPRPEDVCIEDIAHALAMKCRYTGHCEEFYSVAQHSVMVSHIVPMYDALWGLLHDAGEAYLADLARPVKKHMPEFQQAEARIMECVATHFGLTMPEPKSIANADLVMLRTERRDLMKTPPRPWKSDNNAVPLVLRIVGFPPSMAKDNFMRRFHILSPRPSPTPSAAPGDGPAAR